MALSFVRNTGSTPGASKTFGLLARTHTRAREVDSGQAEKLSDLLRPHVRAAIRTWVDGLKATKIWWNGDSKAWEDSGLPDHEVRRRNALHIVEYAIGKPIERSMEVTASYKELSTVLEELRQSPEARRLLSPELFETLQTAAESKESELPTSATD